LEHPVFFIGYSLSDENIASILGSISEIMTTNEQREKIAKNLIFVNRAKGSGDSISETQLRFLDNKSIPITQVKTDEFSKVYLAFQGKERKIPAHILRIFREQFYQIVQGESPEKKLYCATNVDEIMDGKSDIEFVAGFGLSRGKIGDIGLQGIEIESLIKDIVFDDLEFEADEILTKTFPKIINKGKYIPIKKYQKESGLSFKELEDLGLKELIQRSNKYYLELIHSSYHRTYKNRGFKSLDDIINSDLADTGKFEVIGWYILEKKIDLAKISEYLKSNFKKAKKNSSFKKLVCIYDLIKYEVK
jgi:hypothetical protein